MGPAHPALAPAAGLTSGNAHVAVNRFNPVKESSDYTERFAERRVKGQVVMPVPQLTSAYTNADIDFSRPTDRPLLATNGLPRNFKIGNRCVNPLEPRYVLPGCSSIAGPGGAVPSPRASTGTLPVATSSFHGSVDAGSGAASPRRPGSERLLVPAMSLPRSADVAGAASSPRLQPLASPSGAAAFSQQQQSQHHLQHNGTLHTNGAVGGLLLYGPAGSAAAGGSGSGGGGGSGSSGDGVGGDGAGPAVGPTVNRTTDAADISGQRRSSSVPPRRTGGYDSLYTSDIVPARRPSPTRIPGCLTTADIQGATAKHRTRDVPSPGRGTLNSADIPGAFPGCLTRASPTTYALGRWPAPAVPSHHFAHTTRVTMLKKPVSIAE